MDSRMATRIVAEAKRLGMTAEIRTIRDGTDHRLRTAVVIGDYVQFTTALIGISKGYDSYKKTAASVKAGPIVINGEERLAVY